MKPLARRRSSRTSRGGPSGRPVTDDDLAPLLAFYRSGYRTGGFEAGVRDALSAILASPHFLYRAEAGDPLGGTRTLSDLELASRLSFFLWSSIPDDELLTLATASRLSRPDVLAAQVTRMLADPRAKSLSEDFGFQWLNIAKLDEITPDRGQFPHASGLLDPRALYKEELRLFIDSVLRPSAYAQGEPSRVQGRSVVDLLTADYTFLNERLAMLYGIETVKGSHFRRVPLADRTRSGLLGKGGDPDADGVSESHVARVAGGVDPGSPARDAADRSAEGRAVAPGESARAAGENAASPPRAASRECDLLRLSRRHGSAWLRDGELQRDRAVPGQRPGHAHADRHRGAAAGWHADSRTRRSAQGSWPTGRIISSSRLSPRT
jgi:hypothetical protein